ncbi:MAG: leucine-rich repeat domain-containing protein [Clostridia bacterium]|nr:leucine-rich repeat domain-containing protein [Clostridia bacterium]
MKKFIAGLVALVLILSLAVIPAAGAEGETIEENGFVCVRLRDGNLKLVQYTQDGAGKTVNIPSTISGSHIEQIGSYAFDGNKMANVTIPDTVKVIETFAFNGCTEIRKISIPNETSFISGNPFTGCTKLVNISLDPKHPTLQVTSDGVLYSRRNRMLICYPCSKAERSFSVKSGTVTIDEYAFAGCDALESISLPATVTEICEGAFLGCTGLINVTLPESLLSIGELAFAGCTSLRGVAIPKNVSRVETSTFYRCESLSNVSFPENLTKICDRAFAGCKELSEIHLPSNTTSIGDEVFNGCEALKDAYIPVSVTDIGKDAFENCSVSLYMHLDEYAYAEIYAKLYDISIDYGNRDDFLTDSGNPDPVAP